MDVHLPAAGSMSRQWKSSAPEMARPSQTSIVKKGKPFPRGNMRTMTDKDGNIVLSFLSIHLSDRHWSSGESRAETDADMLQNTYAERTRAVGDNRDLESARQNRRMQPINPWHIQGLAHIRRKLALIIPGNHDDDLRGKIILNKYGEEKWHRKCTGKRIAGFDIVDNDIHETAQGEKLLVEHGDKHDDVAFGKWKKFWYVVGDFFYKPFVAVDTLVRRLTGKDDFSIAAPAKWMVKLFTGFFLGVKTATDAALDEHPHIHGRIGGHTHDAGFTWTPNGKLNANCGSATKKSECLVEFFNGELAIMTWGRTHIHFEEKSGAKYSISRAELGLRPYGPLLILDEHTRQAERLEIIFYRLAPPKDRKKTFKILKQAFTAAHAMMDTPHPSKAQTKKINRLLRKAFKAEAASTGLRQTAAAAEGRQPTFEDWKIAFLNGKMSPPIPKSLWSPQKLRQNQSRQQRPLPAMNVAPQFR